MYYGVEDRSCPNCRKWFRIEEWGDEGEIVVCPECETEYPADYRFQER